MIKCGFVVFVIAALFVGPILLSRKATRNRIAVLIGAFFVELCLIALAASLYDTVCCTEETFGTIETIKKKRGAKGRTKYYAEIVYEVDGLTYREEARFRWFCDFSKRNYREGDAVALLYNPAHADHVIVKSLCILQPTEYLLLAVLFLISLIHIIKKEPRTA